MGGGATNLWPEGVAKAELPSWAAPAPSPARPRGPAAWATLSNLNPEYQSTSALGTKLEWRGPFSGGESRACLQQRGQLEPRPRAH